ncbi:MAG: hypothetical protein ACYC5Y_13285 [Symbiobacteriia bacterium]
MSRLDDLNRFYELMDELRTRVGGYRYLSKADGRSGWPSRGVYFFFEPGEEREGCRSPRVVRVGTHGVSEGSKSTLWGRLVQHKGHDSGNHPGGGNHRGSVFRLHVGTALLNRGGYGEDVRESWFRAHPDESTRDVEHQLEKAVSEHIRSLPFLWVAIADPSSKYSDRSVVESNSVGLLSNRGRTPIDPASEGWLGRHADRPAVRESGMWNVDFVDKDYDPAFLEVLARYVRAM